MHWLFVSSLLSLLSHIFLVLLPGSMDGATEVSRSTLRGVRVQAPLVSLLGDFPFFLSLIWVFGRIFVNSGSISFILQLVIFCLLLVLDLGFGRFQFLYGRTGFLIVILFLILLIYVHMCWFLMIRVNFRVI